MSVNIYDPSTDTLTQVPGTRNNDAAVDTMFNVLGAKNLLPNNATSQTINEVTFTVNSDGSVTANGTANGNAECIISSKTPVGQWFQTAGKYLISGGDELQGDDDNRILSMYFEVFISSPSRQRIFDLWCTESNPTHEITITDEYINNSNCCIQCLIRVWNGKTVSSKTVYPMIRPLAIADDTFVPYAMTNSKITKALTFERPNIPWNDSLDGSSYYNRLVRIGDEVFIELEFNLNEDYVNSTILYYVPEGFRPKDTNGVQMNCIAVSSDHSYTNITQLHVRSNGQCIIGADQRKGEFMVFGHYQCKM